MSTTEHQAAAKLNTPELDAWTSYDGHLWLNLGPYEKTDLSPETERELLKLLLGRLDEKDFRRLVLERLAPGLEPDHAVTVCAECHRACCWQGEFMCDASQEADVLVLPVDALVLAGREHPEYWGPKQAEYGAPDCYCRECEEVFEAPDCYRGKCEEAGRYE